MLYLESLCKSSNTLITMQILIFDTRDPLNYGTILTLDTVLGGKILFRQL